MPDFFNFFHSLSLIVVSGFHASELLVAFVVAIAFLTMAALGREHEETETNSASLDDERHEWLTRLR